MYLIPARDLKIKIKLSYIKFGGLHKQFRCPLLLGRENVAQRFHRQHKLKSLKMNEV